MKKSLFLILLPAIMFAQSTQKIRVQEIGADTVSSNHSNRNVYVKDTLKLKYQLDTTYTSAKIKRIVAGDNVTVSPSTGLGTVTVTVPDQQGLWQLDDVDDNLLMPSDTSIHNDGTIGGGGGGSSTDTTSLSNRIDAHTDSIAVLRSDLADRTYNLIPNVGIIPGITTFSEATTFNISNYTYPGTSAGVVARQCSTASSTTLTNIPTTAGIRVGHAVSGTDIPSNTTVASIVSISSVTISQSATGTHLVTASFGTADSASAISLLLFHIDRPTYVASVDLYATASDSLKFAVGIFNTDATGTAKCVSNWTTAGYPAAGIKNFPMTTPTTLSTGWYYFGIACRGTGTRVSPFFRGATISMATQQAFCRTTSNSVVAPSYLTLWGYATGTVSSLNPFASSLGSVVMDVGDATGYDVPIVLLRGN